MQKISIIIQPMSPINWALKTPQKGHLFRWSTSCSSILQLLKTFIFPPDFQAIFARFLYLHHDNLPLYFCDKSLNLVLWNRDANNSLNLLYFFFFLPLITMLFLALFLSNTNPYKCNWISSPSTVSKVTCLQVSPLLLSSPGTSMFTSNYF